MSSRLFHLRAGSRWVRCRAVCWFALAGLLYGRLPTASAEEFQVVAFASLSSSAELSADFDALGHLVQNPSLGKALTRVLADVSGVQQLPGLDRSRSCGVAILTDGLRVAPIAFVPVTDIEGLLASLEGLIGPAVEQPELSPRIWKIGRGAMTGYVRQQAGWAYVAQTPDLFDEVLSPNQIRQEFARLPAGHDLAVRFYPLRLPEALRTYGIDLLRQQSGLATPIANAEEDDAAAARQRLQQRVWQLCELSLTDQQEVTWSWRFDRQAKQARLDLEIVPAPDGVLARHLAVCKKLSTPTMTPREPMLIRLCVGIGFDAPLAEEIRLVVDDMSQAASDKPAAKAFSSQAAAPVDSWQQLFIEIARSELGRGRFCSDLAVTGGNLPVTALLGLQGSGLPAIEPLLDRIEARDLAAHGGARLERNERQIGGRQVHRIHLPSADQTSLVAQCFGNPPTCQLTATPQTWLLALGPQSHAAIEQSLERPSVSSGVALDQAMPHMTLSIHVGNAVSLLSSALADQRQQLLLSLISANLRAADDRLVFTMEPAPDRLQASVVLHEGILRAAAMGLNIVALESLSRPAANSPQPSAATPR